MKRERRIDDSFMIIANENHEKVIAQKRKEKKENIEALLFATVITLVFGSMFLEVLFNGYRF